MRIPDDLDRIPWLAAGYHELQAGVARYGTVGSHGEYVAVYDAEHHVRNNPRILEYFTATTLHTTKESTSWCSAFVNWCMRQSGIVGTRSAAARSWLKWHGGEELDEPRIGAVVVFPRPPVVTQGHVAMIWDVHDDGSLEVLGAIRGRTRPMATLRPYRLTSRSPIGRRVRRWATAGRKGRRIRVPRPLRLLRDR